jgi:hypothetical protein|nr:MAG TPA: hypothetical protein [Caudoviricetes sp.]
MIGCGGNVQAMNENIKDLLKLIDEHPDLPVIPMVGQDIVADCTGEWVAYFGKAEVKKMCIYGEKVVFREEKNAIKTVEALELEGLTEGRAREESLEKLNGYLDELEWLEVIIVHIETPTVKIPDNTDTINELLGD